MTRSIFIASMALALTARIAGADEPTEAEILYETGQAAFDAKQFDEAVAAWERSYELSNEPALFFNIGQAYRARGKPGDCAKARDAYRKFVELDTTSDRSIAEGFAIEMEKCAGREASTPLVTTPPAPLTKPPNAESGREAAPTRTKQIAGFAVVGGGVALLATGFYFGHRASSLADEVTNACDGGCDWAVYGPKDQDGRSAQTKQWIFGGIGVVGIIGGGVLYWLGARESKTSTVAVTSRSDGASVTWGGSW